MRFDVGVRKLTDDELADALTDVINDREGVRDGTRRAERLDDLYGKITNEQARRRTGGGLLGYDGRGNALLSGNRTGYAVYDKGRGVDLVEWKCPECKHRWFEYSDADEYPLVCPMCGSDLPGSGMDE